MQKLGLHFSSVSIIVNAKIPTAPLGAIRLRKRKEGILLKIERINENQIRCTLTSVDLSARNIKLSELAYGSEKTRELFRDMIQQASLETGFVADDIPLVIEAIPLGSGSIMLIITKVEDPEELDSRFSRFAPSPDEDLESQVPPLDSEQLEGADSLMNLLSSLAAQVADSVNREQDREADSKKTADSQSSLITPASENGTTANMETDRKSAGAGKKIPDSKPAIRFYAFPDFDAAAKAARICDPDYTGISRLYKSPAGTYLLVLRVEDSEDIPFIHICNRLSDYASQLKVPAATEAYFAEHYDLLIKKDALRHLAML